MTAIPDTPTPPEPDALERATDAQLAALLHCCKIALEEMGK
jgi:hypothetical protein